MTVILVNSETFQGNLGELDQCIDAASALYSEGEISNTARINIPRAAVSWHLPG